MWSLSSVKSGPGEAAVLSVLANAAGCTFVFHSLSLSICWRTRWPIRPRLVAYGADAVWKTKCLKKTKVTLPTLSFSYRFLCLKKKKEREKMKRQRN